MPKRGVSIFDPPVDSIDPQLDPYQVAAVQRYLQDNNVGLSLYTTGRENATKARTKLYEQMLKDDEYKRMASSVNYSNASLGDEIRYGYGTKGAYEYPEGDVVLFRPEALPHENYHANALRGEDPFESVAKYLYPAPKYDAETMWGLLNYESKEHNTMRKERNAMYAPLRSAVTKWVKYLRDHGLITSSGVQAVEYGFTGGMEEMLAEIAGSRFLIPESLFSEEETKAMDMMMRDRYSNKEFPGIMEYVRGTK